jgi:hypothetical protein
MASERRQQWLLGALVVVLVVVAYREWPRTAATPVSSSKPGGAAAANTRGAAGSVTAPDVHLDSLQAQRSVPAPTTRNLFRFKPKAPPPPPQPPPSAGHPEGRSGAASGAGGPPPLPPIPLKFIGIVDLPGQRKVAVLRDPVGNIDYGGEGAIIGGRYRVLRIGVESIEMAYVDGNGRQTIRLTGS